MAYYLITIIKNFIGESFDTKPTDAVPPGSTFFETDTKNRSIYTGAAWAFTHGSVVYAIRAAQGLKITEEEYEYEPVYHVTAAVQRLAFAESFTGRFILPISGASDAMAVAQERTLLLDGNISGSDGIYVSEVGEIAVT